MFATALAGRDDVLIGTKGGHFRTGPREWDVDNSPSRLRRDVDDSLPALGVDRTTMERTVRPSARYLGAMAAANAVLDPPAAS